MRYGFITIFTLLFACTVTTTAAQQYIFKNYTVNDGLVANHIRRIFQDSKGFLWIATWEGLSKYDGHQFTNYTTGNGLSYDLVNDIYEAKDGMIYIACNDGSIHSLKNNEAPEDITENKIIINSLVKLPGQKAVAVTDYQGLWEFTDGKLYKPRQTYPGHTYYDITSFNDSLFIAQSDSSIEIINYRYELFSEWREDGYFANACLFADSKKRTWLGTSNGLKLLSPNQVKGKPIRLLELPPAFNLPFLKTVPLSVFFEDAGGNMWIGTYYNGLIKIGADGSQEFITEKNGLPAPDITCIFQDRENNIWIGTSLGIAKLVTKNNIRTYTVEEGLLSNNVFIVFPFSDDTIIVESVKGLQFFDKVNNRFLNAPAEKNYYQHNDPNSSLSLLRNGKNKTRYVTYFQKPLSRFSFGPNWIGPYYAYKDNYGNFFSPSTAGVMISRDIATWEKVLYDFDTRAILVDSKNNLWVGSWGKGLYRIRYEYVNNKFHKVSEEHFLPGTGIRSLFEDSKGNIWVGTRHHGIYCINPDLKDKAVIHHFDQLTGLTSNRIVTIGEDKTGSIWISFLQGLDKLIPDKNSYRVFNFSRVNNFFANIHGIMFGRDYSLWLGTTKGLVHISDGALENAAPLKTYITTATLGDSIYRNYGDKKISISYRHRKVQFEFAAPGFINEKQTLYSYRLLGSNTEEWAQASDEHSVSYASLQPGNYTFEVRSLGWNGIWGEPAHFEFTISPPFWQTWWFWILAALLIAGLVFVLVRRRIKNIRHEAEMKHKLAETEMAALRAQMNPHFIFNCINSIDALIQSNDKYQATVYLNKFAKLIRNILDSSKQNLVPLNKDLETLKLYVEMEQFRNENKFTCEIIADDVILQDDYKVPPLIIQPFVENAILHGLRHRQDNNGNLAIIVKKKEGYLQYIIEDNGVGRNTINNQAQKEKLSYGIDMTNDRVKLFNNEEKASVQITDLFDDDKPAGTKVEVFLKTQ